LVEANTGLLYFVAHRMQRYPPARSYALDELASWGIEGLLKAAERYDAARGAKFSTYAVQSIRWSMLHAVQRDQQRREREVVTTFGVGDDDTPEPAVDGDEDRADMLEAIALLPADLREAVRLRFWSGLGYREMGSHLDISGQAASLRVRRATAVLRSMVE
jgi:RNA polymerase sigma factor (sigma-70 family)